MAAEQECGRLAEQLLEILDRGLVITTDTLFFAESTYGIAADNLEAVLTDAASEDGEILLELIFYPDQAIRNIVESVLGEATFNRQDETLIAQQIMRCKDRVRLSLPDGSNNFPITITEQLIGNFITKLYISRILDPDIHSIIDESLSASTAIFAKVFLRCRNYNFSGKARQFLAVFIKKAAVMEDTFCELFEITLALLSQVPENTAIGDYFLEQRQMQKKTLEDIREFEKKREQYSMEYLMMQKYSVPHESEETVSHRLRMLTTIIDDILQIQPAYNRLIDG